MDDNTESEGEVLELVLRYLQNVLVAIDTVIDSSSPHQRSTSPQVLVEAIASRLLHAFQPQILSAPLPSVLANHDDSKPVDEGEDEDFDDRENLTKGGPLPRKRRRIDYLRTILRGMAPIALDAAVLACSFEQHNENSTSIVILLSTWLPLAPQITPLASRRLKGHPFPFEDVESSGFVLQWHVLEALHSLCRHYANRDEHTTLNSFWNWTPLYQYLDDTNNAAMEEHPWFPVALRWHAARAMSFLNNQSPGNMGSFLKRMLVSETIVPWVLHPWILHQEEYDWEIQHIKGVVGLLHSDSVIPLPTGAQIRKVLPLHSCLAHLGEGLVFFKQAPSDTTVSSTLVLTATTQKNLGRLAAALSLDPYPRPILVSGPAGSGKSSLVRHLVSVLQGSPGSSLLELHIDDETDSKTLIGSYTTTDIPGEFTWQPGALTRAVRNGQWVLLEDLDTIPIEILAALIPLLEDRRLPLGNGEMEVCNPNFRMFATLSVGDAKRNNIRIFSSRLWTRVEIYPPQLEEWKEVAHTKFPKIPKSVSDAAFGILQLLLSGTKERHTIGRTAAVRDFLKLLSRISNTVTFADPNVAYTTEAQRTLCIAETLDVFASHCPEPTQIRDFATQIAAPAWGLTSDVALHYLEARRPELNQTLEVTKIGRALLRRSPEPSTMSSCDVFSSFAITNTALRLLESIAVCVRENESTLLVGETGVGKTCILQQLAHISGHSLVVQNLSLQTDSADLLGGFRPMEISQIARIMYLKFVDIFVSTFSRKQNIEFLNFASSAYQKRQWKKLSQCFRRATKLGLDKIKKAPESDIIPSLEAWEGFADASETFERQRLACDTKLAFTFTEGALVEAIRTGKWVLLDEINLASSETLQRLCGLLDDSFGSVTLTERGDAVAIKRDPAFRLFAAMNPATDSGKKDLPASIRSRFTEIYVDELRDPVELRVVAAQYLSPVLPASAGPIEHSETIVNVVEIYLKCRELASRSLADSGGQRPRYTLRTMCRALTASRNLITEQKLSLVRGIMEGFELAFVGPLETESAKSLLSVFQTHWGTRVLEDSMDHPGRRPGGRNGENEYVLVKPFWIKRGPLQPEDWSDTGTGGRARFILTSSMSKNLRRLTRAVASGPWPVLLEGPTSSGKTTIVEYLAARCGHKVVRINNHEHTDIQEYTGAYATDENGSLVFCDGILVQALRTGHWVILDELNLAPSEVLEALNRLLDDNRELYLPEKNETVKPHPSFRLFATQNPCGAYGGRKPLSRAFRNRFVEIHMGDIPSGDMTTILEKRCGCPPSHAKLLIKTMISLRQRRSTCGVFLGKDSLITPRDLLRWAERRVTTREELAQEGFMLLGERLRSDTERHVVREEIEMIFNVSISPREIYYSEKSRARRLLVEAAATQSVALPIDSIAQTKSILRLLSIILRCVEQKEPVLLIGDTGTGKTTVVQLLSTILQRNLKIVNCHATTETSDLIGGLRPVRSRSNIPLEMALAFRELMAKISDQATLEVVGAYSLLSSLDDTRNSKTKNGEELASSIISVTRELWRLHSGCQACQNTREGKAIKKRKLLDAAESPSSAVENSWACDTKDLVDRIEGLYRSFLSLFEWVDGSLVQSMRNGDIFLLDEMSLAEDAVLERLNSVLEPVRTIVLAEKGNGESKNDSHIVKAHDNFLIFATMNPGGDFGKRELSPALRSRFTEIWVPGITEIDDIRMVLHSTFLSAGSQINFTPLGSRMLEYVEWFNTTICGDPSFLGGNLTLTLRDIISWAQFVIVVAAQKSGMSQWEALCHGAALMHLDGLGLGTGLSRDDAQSSRLRAMSKLIDLIPEEYQSICKASIRDNNHKALVTLKGRFGIHPFSIPLGPFLSPDQAFNFKAPTTCSNLLRVLRAMQLPKPVMLEGPPGVGKTTLIAALAKASGYNLVRINLSEQTDMSDLMGSDLPFAGNDIVGQSSSNFRWCDGILLAAIKRGDWVLLDELNLATQSVLEGLNSCLDHRANVFVPELGKTFQCPSSFRVFAAQNPLGQGGGRKGLPKSFLNRFTKVYVKELENEDLRQIVESRFPDIPDSVRDSMISFNSTVHESIVHRHEFGDVGSPWEFNLRDVFRWCELAQACGCSDSEPSSLGKIARDLYLQRLRATDDREKLSVIYSEIFQNDDITMTDIHFDVSEKSIKIGSTHIRRRGDDLPSSVLLKDASLLRNLLLPMEAVSRCVQMRWPCLLVGPPSSGKKIILRSLAHLLNVHLSEICLTPSTDVNELVGSFEQVEHVQQEKKLLKNLESLVKEYAMPLSPNTEHVNMAKSIRRKYSELSEIVSTGTLWEPFITISGELLRILRSYQLVNGHLLQETETLWSILSKKLQRKDEGGGLFHWVDGILVDAMIKGYWLHLKNVNLCSASVLDRLNPLLEPGGELLLSESFHQDGTDSHRSIKPHPQFRLFLSMNADRGEVSRAMRNRCVEISLLDHTDRELILHDNALYCDHNVIDHLDELSRRGTRSFPLAMSILNFHKEATKDCRALGKGMPAIECPGFFASWIQDLRVRGVGSHSSTVLSRQLSFGMDTIQSSAERWRKFESELRRESGGSLLPVALAIRGDWSTIPNSSPKSFLARPLHFLQNGLPNFPTEFCSIPSCQRECELNAVCPTLASSDECTLRMQALALFLRSDLASEEGISFMTHINSQFSRILQFMRAQLLKFPKALMPFLMDRIAHLAREKMILDTIETSGIIRLRGGEFGPVLDVSFLLFMGKLDRSVVSCQITPTLYPVFAAIDEWSTDLFEVTNHLNDSQALIFRKLLCTRDRFMTHLMNLKYDTSSTYSSISFDTDGFIVQWVWLKKAIAILDETSMLESEKVMKSRQRLDALITNIDRVLLDGEEIHDLSGDILWKNGGHPLVPSNCRLLEVRRAIHLTCMSTSLGSDRRFNVLLNTGAPWLELDELLNILHPTLFIEPVHRQELLQGLSMAQWFSVDELPSMSSAISASLDEPENFNVICQNIEDGKVKLASLLKASKVDTRIATVENLMDVDALEQLRSKISNAGEAERRDVPLLLMNRFSDIQIAPILEFWLIHEEDYIIRQVAALLLSEIEDKGSRQKVLELVRQFVSLGLSSCVWPTCDLRPYQTMIWALESDASTMALRYLLRCLFPSMLHNFCFHLWQNTYNDLCTVSPRLEFPHQWSSTHERKNPADSERAWKGTVGPTRLRESVQADTILRLVGPEFSMALVGGKKAHYLTLENHEVRRKQAIQLISHMSKFGIDRERKSTPSDLHYLVLNIIEAFRDYFPVGTYESISALVETGIEGVVSEACINETYNMLSHCTHPKFRRCFKTIGYPFLRCLGGVYSNRNQHDACRAWLYVGLLRYHLLVPQSPLDPGQKPVAKVEQLNERLRYLQSCVAACRLDSGVKFGDFSPHGLLLDIWVSEITDARRKRDSQEKKKVCRPKEASPFIDLFREIRHFQRSGASTTTVIDLSELLLSSFSEPHLLQAALSREENWQTTSESFCERLREHYCYFEDVTVPLLASIRCIQRGLRELRDLVASSCSNPIQLSLSFSLGSMLQFPFDVNNDPLKPHGLLETAIQSLSLDISPQDTRKCFLALSLSTLSRLALSMRSIGKHKLMQTMSLKSLSIFDKIVAAWIRNVDGLEAPDSTDDEAQERLYREQFPNFNSEFNAFIEAQEDHGGFDEESTVETETERGTSSEIVTELTLTDDHISIMYDIYLNLFSEAATSNVEVVRLRSFQLTYGCVFLLRDASFLAFNGDRKFEEMGSHCLAVSLSSTGQANVLNFSPVTPSFHGNANPREVQKASGLLQNLMSRAYQLLTAFPGHEVLIALGQVAEYVRKLELTTTSVAKALRALEIVLRKAQEWEQHASERVKLGSCLVEISQLVATWRRMELQSWEALLESREERFVKRARRHWIRLYSLLNKGSKGDEQIQLVSKRKDRHEIASWIWRGMGRRSEKTEDQGSDVRLEGLAKAIDTFILTSTVGEFQERLGLIKSFAHQFALYSDAHGLSLFRLLISVGTYYSQFTAFLQSWRQKMKNPIWNRLKDEVKLAKWDEQSYYSLLDSTERNHRKLMKLLREYDNVLETSVVSLLEQYFCDGVRSLDGTAPLHRVKLPSNKELFPLESDAADKLDAQKMSMSSVKVESRKRTWAADTYSNTSPLYDIVHQLPRYHRKMHKFIFTGLIGSPSPARAGQISSAQLCTNIFKRIESLRQDKITKQMKQRALADLFRVLKKNGFKSSKWAIPAQLRQMMFVFQLPVPPSTSFPLDSTWQLSELEKAEVYFQKVLSESRRLRSEVSMSGSIYMTAREMEVMSNFSDHGLFLISQQRSIIADAAPALSTFKKHVETLCSLKGGVPRCQRELLDRIREFELALGSSQECICQLKLIVESSLYLEENDEAKSAKRDTLSLIDECLVQLKANHVAFETEIVTSASLEQLRKVREVLSIIVGHLNSCSDLNRMCLPCDAFDTTIECVQKAIHLSLKCNASTKELEDIVPEKERIESFLRTTKKTIESALILIQKVYKLRECGERNIDDSEGDDIDTTLIWDNHKQVCSELNDLNIKGIAHECKEVIDCIVSMSESVVTKEDQKLVLSVASDATEILVLVLCVFEAWMEDTVSFFRSCAKLQYVLCRIFRALVANGYCHDSTIEENARNEGEGDTGGMKFEDNIEGTGMGEGEGKEDVTDQLESEEQLLGLKDEKPKEKNTEKSDESKKLDEEEALKGMEMEADFEGDLFDVPDEQNDKEDERESDNEEELDREMGEGPNESEDVVDEKLWGDSDNEEEINHKEEKFEKDSKVKGESIEETRTKDKEEPPENSDQTDTEDRSDKNQQNMDDEADPAVEINEDREERYEDKHAGIDAREDEVDNGIIDEEMNLDDDIELDRENEDSDSEQETTDKIDQPEDDDDDNAAKTRVDESSLADENENPDDTDAMDTDADPAGASGVPEGEDDKGGQDDEEAPKVNQSSTTPASELTYGVQSNNGKDNIQNEPNENNQEEVTEEGGKGQKEENREFNETSHQDNPSGSGGTDGRDGIQNEGYARNATNLQQSNAPNPFKDPGEANKFWHKKLKMVSRASKEIEGDESGQEEDSPAENEKEKDVDFEYAAKNEASSTQVLGEVTEETSGTNFNDELHEDRDNENEAKPPQADMDHFREEDQHPSHKTTQPSSLSKDSTAQPMDDEDDEGDNEEQGEKSQDDADNLEVLDQTGEEIDRENKVVSDLTQIRLEDEDVEMAEAGNIVEEEQITGISSMEITESRARWNKIAGETHNLSRRLCEKLRLVMEPLVATKLKGDYRSGKRINMKKVISFIASEYRKDKIWLRRTKPAKRNYRILLAVDNSESMSKNGAGEMALSAMATLAVGMGQLEIGELGIASFGDEMKLLHPFHLPFASEHGATLVHNFSFDEKRTRTALCVESALTAMGMSGDHASLQLVFVISDGRIERDSRATLRRLMREMVERNILLVMIVVEGDGVSKKKKDSIVHMKEVTFENGRPKVRQFIEDYPFPYYIILDDMHALPEVLGDALRQWFEMIAQLQQYR